MSDLIEKVARAIEGEFVDGAFADDVLVDFKFPAKAAVAIVLRGMMKPSEVMLQAGASTLVYPGIGDTAMVRPLLNAKQAEQVFQAMLRAFAAEHNIHIGEGKEGEERE